LTKQLYPAKEFQYRFSDELLEQSYESENTASTLVNIFAGISILISCLGLFGLSAFTAEQRSKEVGVRKVLGSSVFEIVFMLSKEYAKLIVIAFIIAVPFGYYLMQDWLNNFEFRTVLEPHVFLLAGLISLIIGALTISFKSYQAAVVNPVKSLKNE
jgi:ABC-type antimicrobial peptide transport system permease subunit